MTLEFASAGKIIFGREKIKEIGLLATEMGSRALLVYGGSRDRVLPVTDRMHDQGIEPTLFSVSHEPTIDLVQKGRTLALTHRCDMVIGVGGGSVIDTAKALAILVTNKGDIYDYLEIVGEGHPFRSQPVPCIVVPTTAGTGSEVTKNAVLASPQHRVKVSMRSTKMLPTLALIDPVLTLSMPPSVTAHSGLDALTQLVEPYLSPRSNPLTDAIAREGIKRAARALPRVYENGQDLDAREDMCLASLFSGLSFANAKLGAVHGFAGPFGGMFDAPNGAVCARLLPFVMHMTIMVMQEQSERFDMSKYDDIGTLLTGSAKATAKDGVRWIFEVIEHLQIKPLSEYGLKVTDIPELIEKAKKASSMKGHPIKFTDVQLAEIVHRAM